MIDFTTLAVPKSPHFYLLCPHGYRNESTQDTSPVFKASMESLKVAVFSTLNNVARNRLINENEHANQYTFEFRSLLFRLPNTLHIQFIFLSQTETTLAVFSHSNYGYYDFGVNKRRVKRLIRKVQRMLQKEAI